MPMILGIIMPYPFIDQVPQSNNVFFHKTCMPIVPIVPTHRYIDPTYMIRAVPANAFDSTYCSVLAQMAVHAALATWPAKFRICCADREKSYQGIASSVFGDI